MSLPNDILYNIEKFVEINDKFKFRAISRECHRLIDFMKLRITIMDVKLAKILMIEHDWKGYYNHDLRKYVLRVPYGLVYNYISNIKYTTINNYFRNLPVITIHMAVKWTIDNMK